MNINTFSIKPRGSKLSDLEIAQREEYINGLSSQFNSSFDHAKFDLYLLDKLKSVFDCSDYTTPMWEEHLQKINSLIRSQDKSILLDNLVRYAIYLSIAMEWSKTQLPYLEKQFSPEKLKDLLLESTCLNQNIINPIYMTSESRVNHLTHLASFEEKVKISISSLENIVEFGGGYGGMTVVVKKMAKKNATVLVIDVPEMIVLQSYYVSQVLGAENINIILDEKTDIKKGKINYVPLTLSKFLSPQFNADLFIATWSLSESNDKTVNLVDSANFFNAKHLLYGYRYYSSLNLRQPMSGLSPKMRLLDFKYHGPTFWCLDKEQYYFFV